MSAYDPKRTSASRSEAFSAGFAREERITEDLELARFLLAASAFERIDRLSDLDVDETAIFQHFLPGCARQTTGNSCGP
jgi:hypothetical protein